MNSGLSTMPVIVTSRFWPLRVTPKLSPGANPWAVAKASLTTTSSWRPASGSRPARRMSWFICGSPEAGIEMIWPMAGLSRSAMSRMANSLIRASTRATPSMAAISGTSVIGAREASDQTSAKRARS